MQNIQKRFIAILSFALIMLTTFAYSALATNLSITGEANFRKVADIRVTNISINGASGATSEYENYKKDTITAGFTLNNTSSTMTYNVTITNNGDIDQAIYNLTTQSSNNSGLSILIDGQPINQALPIIVPFGTSRTITITYSSSTPGTVNVVNKFDFRKVYYITYNLKGGTSSSSDLTNGQVKYENVDLTLTNDEPTLSGYEFLGWTDEQNGTTVKFEPGDTYTIDGANKILYAIYKKDNYTITFDAQDGSENQTKEVQVGDQIGTLPTHQRDGYHFDGWYTGQTDGTQITTTTVPDSDKTYYAHYTPYRLTINYYAGGATKNGNTTLQNQKLTTDTYDYDGEDLATAGLKNYDSASSTWNLIKDGYHADKYWHLGNNTSTTKVHEDTTIAKVQDLAASLNKGDDFKTGNVEVNIYAGWTANTYKLHFDKNNTNATGVMSDQTLTYDAPEANRKINKNIYAYTGHTFVGWNTQANGQGTPYTDEQVINLVTTNNQTINLYAQWITNTYTVTYNANGGTVSPSSKQVTYGDTYGTLPEPSKTGYTFNGWFTDNTYTTEVTSSTPVTITDNQTIIAKWTANNYTVTANANGGTFTSAEGWSNGSNNTKTKSVTFDQVYGTLPEVSRQGYTFEGWSKENLFDIDSTYTVTAGGTYTYTLNVKPNTTYTMFSNCPASTPANLYFNGGSTADNGVSSTQSRTSKSNSNGELKVHVRYTKYGSDQNEIDLYSAIKSGTYYAILVEGDETFITSSTIVKTADNHTLYAQFSANELVFNNQTSSVTYNAGSASSINIVGASNGTGSYTYSKVSESNGTSDTTYFTVSGNKINASANTPAGTYTVVVKATDDGSGVTKDATYTITVNKQKVNVPSCATFTYNKATQTFLSNTDSYTVTNNTGLNAGDYTVKATPTSNYMWSDDTTTTKDIACTISLYNIGTAGNATVSPVVDRVYDGTAYEPTPSVTVPLPSSINTYTLTTSDLTYSYTTDHTNVGEKQVTITGKGNYTGTITKTYNITKADGYITLNKTAENAEYSTTSTSFKVLTNSGALSVTSDKGTASITGDIVTLTDISTLAVGTKVTVTVTSAATNNYKAATATYVLTITNKPLTGGSVKIAGNNIVGNTLTATVTDTTPKADSYTYKWYREGSNTPIATTNTYQVTSDDVGKSLRVVVSATKDNYEGTSFEDTTDATNNKTEIVKTGVTKPTAANYCKSLTYNGESQVLTSAAATGYAFYDNSGIAATSYTVTAKLSNNYIWSNGDTADVTFNCSIAKKDVTVKADNQSKEYDGTALTANTSCTATGTVATHTPSCTTSGTITDYAASGAVKTLSSVKIMDGSTDVSSNYNITKQNGTLTITKKAITITAKNQTVQYGTAISKTTSDVTVATLPSTDTLSSITLSQSKTAVSTDGKITASAAVIKRGTTDTTNNYTITYNQGSLTINKKNITASISSCSNKVYDGNTNATCGITLSGVQSGETATATATCKFNNKNVGTDKEITCNTFVLDGADKGNYNITTTSLTGSANITAKSITPTATASNKTYDGNANATCTISLPGIVSGDTVSSTYTGTFNNKNVGTSKAVTCSDIALTGTDKGNYSLSKTSLSTTANVTAKSVAVSWTNVGPFTYNGSNQGPTASVNTGITGETMTVTATKAINKGAHTSTASCSSVTGSSACGNYTLTNTTKEFTINAQAVNPVTNLSVNTSGVVSWTASSNATGYQISIDGTNWTDMPGSQTSYNYLSVLTATSANKTVYVRAINSDADNYSTVSSGDAYAHSSNATSAVTIRTLTINSNNTNYGTVNNTSFNVINGATYSTSSNVLTLSDGRKSTATKIDVVGYTTTFSSWSPASGTINANTTVTANFTRTANSYTVTANANGGSIASTTGWTGTGNTSTKSVTYDSAYGTLPTVSRTGYTLKGWSLLPNGYKQVEYIQSTGTQYINTGADIFSKTNHEIVVDFEPTSLYNYNTIWGSTYDADTFEGWIYSTGALASRYSYRRYGSDTTITVNERHKLDIYKNNTNLYMIVDGENESNGTTADVSTSTSILLFLSGNDYGKYKMYGSQIYSEGELIRDFVPCVNESTGKAGLYDLVEGKFYGNSGTGDFTVPTDEYFIDSTSIVNIPDDHNIYAKWTANELTFSDKTLSTGTYGTAYTSTAFDQASNGTGSYTYTIKSGAPTGATIDSTNRKISFTSSTPAGTYNVVVTATDNNSGKAKDATMKVVINKANNAITLNCASLTYNKANQNLIASKTALGGDVYIGLESLTASNYTTKGSTALTGAQATNAGSYTVYAYTPGNANYAATSTSKSCSIAKYNISSATVSTVPDHTYDNTVYKPTPSVTVPLPSSTNTYTLTDSEYDYSYSVASPKDVATYTVTMTAKADTSTFTNNYTGSVSKTYKIVQANGYINITPTGDVISYGTSSKTFTISSHHGGTLSTSNIRVTKNGSAVTNSVTATISGSTVTVNNLGSLESGTQIKIDVNSGATTNYKAATTEYTLTVTNAAISGCSTATASISGNNVVGEALTSSMSGLSGSGITYSYQWYTNTSDQTSGGSAISSATSSSFTLTSSQVGKYIYVRVIANQANHDSCTKYVKTSVSANKTATTKTKVAKPTVADYCANPTYNGSAQVITNTAADGYAFSNNSATNYSSTGYDVTASLSTNYIWSDYTTADTTINCNITRRPVTYKADDQSKTYDSTELNANTNCTLTDGTLVSGHSATCTTSGSQTNAGSSTKTLNSVTIMNGSTNVTANYNITKTNGTLTVNKSTPTGTIEVISTTTSSVTIKETTDTSYNMNHWQYKVGSGSWVNFSYEAATSQTYTITGLTAGSTYTIYADFRDSTNTNWANPKPSVSVTLPRISIDAPTGSNFTYDGKSHTGVSSGTGYTLTGDITKTDAGNYTATAKLDSQHKWSDGTTADKTISWKINPKTLTITAANKSMTYGGSAPTYTYTSSGEVSDESPISGTATYTIKSGSTTISNVSTATAGSYSINPSGLTINSNYTPNYVAGTLTINKAANPTTFTAVTGLKYGSTAAMVTVGSKQGTPYYAVGTELTASNYSTAGSTTIPTASSRNAGTYTIYYYIPEVSGKYNVKSGSVSVTIAKTSCPLTVSNGSMYTGATMTLSTRASNNVGTLSYALKSGGNNTTTASTISNGVLTAGAMSTANDNNQTVDVQITEAASTNYNSCTKDVAITVQKNTRTLSWSSTTPAANATLTYGTSYSATASASGSGGTAGAITYSSNNEAGATINSSSGAITVENGNSKAVTITATMARTATVAQATTTRAFTTGKANGYVNLSANSGSVTYGTASKSFTVSSSHGGGLSVSDNNSTASCAISGTTVTCSSLGSINAGTSITVTVTSAATDNYKEASKTYTLSITRAKTATTGSCINPTYNGSAQNLAGGGSNVTYTNNSQTNHGSSDYTVTVTPNSNYAWSDGTYAAKTLSCNIAKATPVITLSSTSGTLNAGATTSVTATVKSGSEASAAGTLTASSNNTSSFTVAPTSSSITSTTAGATKSHTITGVAGGLGKVKFNFTPTDTTNFNSAAQVQYELTVNNKVVITINKDGSAWSSSGKTVELYESGTAKYTLTTSGSQATIYNVNPGTYDVYATKSSLDSTIVDTGVDITVSQNNHQWSEGGNYFVSISYSNVTETINYNTLTLNKGTNVTSVTGAGIYLSNQTASIAATAFTTGYHFGSWSKTSGNTPTSTTASPTTVSMSTPTELTANAALNTYTIAFNKNAPSGVTVSGSMSNLSMTYGTAKNLTANAYSATGYTFVGWNTAANGTGTAYLDKASVNNLTSTNGATVTLYAQWIKNGSVKITGINKVGTQLTASVTAPTPTPAGYTYQWYRGSTAISGATSSKYTPVAADIGSHLKVKVTATYTNYSSVTFEDQTDAMNNSYAVTYGVMSCSSAVVKVNNPAGGPSGVLEASVTTAPSPTPDSYTYQWYRGTTAISGATSSTYTTVAADVGKTVKVRVTGVKTDYVSCYFEDSIDSTNNKSATVVTPAAVDVYYDNTNTGMTCETVQCALDYISRMLVRSGATNTDVQTKEGTDPMTGNTHLCRRATSNELHTETCSRTSYYCYADGYYASGSKGTTTITYGQVGTEGTLATGDAFVCDINGDGTYNATNEMFYYVSDYYDTSSKATNSDYATLIYYNNVVNGSANNTGGAAYESTGNNFYGPRTALTHMPTTISWKDVGLYKNVRAILNESNGNSISGGTSLPIGFNYKGSSSRLLTYQEVYNGCYNGSTAITSNGGLSSKCIFLLENTKYSSSSLSTSAWWFETVEASASLNAWETSSVQSTVSHIGVSSKYEGVRPAIEVKKTDIDY